MEIRAALLAHFYQVTIHSTYIFEYKSIHYYLKSEMYIFIYIQKEYRVQVPLPQLRAVLIIGIGPSNK